MTPSCGSDRRGQVLQRLRLPAELSSQAEVTPGARPLRLSGRRVMCQPPRGQLHGGGTSAPMTTLCHKHQSSCVLAHFTFLVLFSLKFLLSLD